MTSRDTGVSVAPGTAAITRVLFCDLSTAVSNL